MKKSQKNDKNSRSLLEKSGDFDGGSGTLRLTPRIGGFLLWCFLVFSLSAFAVSERDAVPGEWIIKMKGEGKISATALSPLLSGVKGYGTLQPILPESRLFLLRSNGKGDLKTLAEKITTDPQVAYIEPNFRLYADPHRGSSMIPNDPEFDQLWALLKIDAPHAWQITTGSSSVVVAVIDTGIDWTHPDLADNVWTNPDEVPNNKIDDDGNGWIDDVHGWNFASNNNLTLDDNGHGTHIAGVMGAVGNNNLGVVGVNWKVSLLPVKFLGKEGGGTTAGAIAAIDYAVRAGARVLNNSWGGGEYSEALSEAIARAKERGVLFVAASGHEGRGDKCFYPACYPHENVLVVAATDSNDHLAVWTNYGPAVDVAAPGTDILSTSLEKKYKIYSGSSFSTAYTSGVAALILSLFPELSYAELTERILLGSDELPEEDAGKITSGGRINAWNAISGIRAPRSIGLQ